jgi:hypothetical protein
MVMTPAALDLLAVEDLMGQLVVTAVMHQLHWISRSVSETSLAKSGPRIEVDVEVMVAGAAMAAKGAQVAMAAMATGVRAPRPEATAGVPVMADLVATEARVRTVGTFCCSIRTL